MIGSNVLVACCLLGQPSASPDPTSLVSQLGSPRFAEREAASKTLEQQGARAVPALRVGCRSGDLEIRTRSAAILGRVEGAFLTQATLVWLNFDGTPLPEVVQTLRERTGMDLALVPERLPRWAGERVTLHESVPLPFWKALDRLCDSAGLHGELQARGLPSRVGATLGLTNRNNQPVYPASDHGPFRVRLTDLEYQRKIGFATAPPTGRPVEPPRPPAFALQPRAVASVQCLARLQVLAEPRLGLSQSGAVQLLEARDDLGRSLIPSAGSPIRLTFGAGELGSACQAALSLEVPLSRPEPPGKTISLLRGTVPLRVSSRQPDPLVVPLSSAVGRTFDRGGCHVVVHEVRSDPNARQRQIELTYRNDDDGLPGRDEAIREDLGRRSDPLPHQVEIIDQRGRAIPWFQTAVDVEASRITLTLAGPMSSEAREIRFYRLTETSVNLPFSFGDIPMP